MLVGLVGVVRNSSLDSIGISILFIMILINYMFIGHGSAELAGLFFGENQANISLKNPVNPADPRPKKIKARALSR